MMKRKVLTVGEKAEIIRTLENGEKNSEVCKKFGLSSSTVSTLWKNKDTILKAFQSNITESKRLKKSEKPDLDDALATWCTAQRNAGLPLNGVVIKAQAIKIATELGYENFPCTNGWIDRFKNRHNITYTKISKEKISRSDANLSDSMTEWLQKMWQDYKREQIGNDARAQISSCCSNESKSTTEWLETMWLDYRNEYHEDDIYNAEEVGLFYDLTPDTIHKHKEQKCLKGELHDKRLTVFLCANMSGTDKRKLLIIGSSTRPSGFENVQQLPVDYFSNPKAWMTSQIFTSYIHKWDTEIRLKERRIILLINNSPTHTNIPNLTNIKLVFLPPNAASSLQPLHQGIIRTFKTYYRRELLFLLNNRTKKELDLKVKVLDAIRMMNDAWYDVTSECIRNCFVKAMLQSSPEDNENDGYLSMWMKQHDIEIFTDVGDIDDFGKVDDGVVTSGIPTVQEIVAEMKTFKNEEDTKSTNSITEVPSLATAFESVDRLQDFFEARSSTHDDIFKAISLVKHELRKQREDFIIKKND